MNGLATLHALREQRRTHRGAAGQADITASDAAQSGKLVIEVKGIGKSYGGRPIVSNFSTRILRGDRIGIVGPNGSGKTTLIQMLTGALAPESGTVKLGANLAMAALDQHRDSLNPETTVADALTGGGSETIMVGGEPRHVIGYMKDFLFGPEQARTPLGKLSGGERGRLMLAQVLARPSNVLVLDEPTNDLDLETLDVLEHDRRLCRDRAAHQPRPRFPRPAGLKRDRFRKARAAGSNTPAATPTCWRNAALILRVRRARQRKPRKPERRNPRRPRHSTSAN